MKVANNRYSAKECPFQLFKSNIAAVHTALMSVSLNDVGSISTNWSRHYMIYHIIKHISYVA